MSRCRGISHHDPADTNDSGGSGSLDQQRFPGRRSVDLLVGEIAALSAAVAFSFASVCYTFAGRKVDAVTAIAMSLPISWIGLLVIHEVTLGEFFPSYVPFDRWFFLSASGILAYVVAAYCLFNAFQQIGPRLTLLITAFAPVLSAILAWVFLGQTLPLSATIGIAAVLFGIVWVVAERNGTQLSGREPEVRQGVVYASLATVAQAAAFVLASRGVSGGFPPFSATLIRITAGMITLWAFVAVRRNVKATATIFRKGVRLSLQLLGAGLLGPVTAGSLLLLSFQHAPVGVATTLANTTAIILIPIGYFVFKERITPRAIVGTLVTIIGIAILFAR